MSIERVRGKAGAGAGRGSVGLRRAAALAVLLVALILSVSVWAGTYTSSKHGDSAAGVDRSAVIGEPYPDAVPYAKGHCGHCHEQHLSIGGVEPNPAGVNQGIFLLFEENYGLNKNRLCFACHDTFALAGQLLGYGRYGIYQGQMKYDGSIHATSINMKWSPDPSPPGPSHSDAGNCNNCHDPHGRSDANGVIPGMLRARDSATGDAPKYEMGCEACHDGSQGGLLKNVKAQLDKTYGHPTHSYNSRHGLPETGQPSGSSFGPENRHAECVDCHNPHGLGPNGISHTPPGNAVSEALANVWGVEPVWPSAWTQPASFTDLKPVAYPDGSQYEYQICFKCHSYYGLGTLSTPVSTILGPSGAFVTDQAWEFNVNNKSAHPVVAASQGRAGSTAPEPLSMSQMSSPWTAVGMQTMHCSDCHGADDEEFSGAKGPHGSTRKFMLKGARQFWPAGSSGVPFSLNDISGQNRGSAPYNVLNINWQNEIFCLNCHDSFPSSDSGTWKTNAHRAHNDRQYNPTLDGISHNVYCVTCHTAVPHGNRVSRLIVYVSQSAPYAYSSWGSNLAALEGFKKASDPQNYQPTNCYSNANGCHSPHGTDDGGYD